MTREEAKSELMQLYGSLSEEKKMALDVLMAQADGDHDGCKDCVYQANPQDAMPCRECKHNYIDKWKAIPSAKPKTGHWIIIDDCEKFIAKCSECGQIEDSRMIGKYAYCHCGARMVEPQEGSEE